MTRDGCMQERTAATERGVMIFGNLELIFCILLS